MTMIKAKVISSQAASSVHSSRGFCSIGRNTVWYIAWACMITKFSGALAASNLFRSPLFGAAAGLDAPAPIPSLRFK